MCKIHLMEKETCRLEMPEGESYEQKRALSICLIGHVLDYMVDHSVIADYKPITNKSIYHYPKLAPDFNVQFKGKNFGLYVAVNDKDFYRDRKSTRLNSSHTVISYAVFCLKKKKNNK